MRINPDLVPGIRSGLAQAANVANYGFSVSAITYVDGVYV